MKKRLTSLQALRGIAFLLIFLSHCTFIEIFASSWGGVGVSVFIILSGFVVTVNADLENAPVTVRTLPYFKKRVCKIIPLHLIMLLFRILVDHIFLNTDHSLPLILLNVTMTKSFVPVRDVYYSMGGVSWYLTLVWVFALFTPLLLRTLKKLMALNWFIPVFAFILFFRAVYLEKGYSSSNSQWLTYINPFFRMTEYFLGMMLGTAVRKCTRLLQEKRLVTLLEVAVWSTFILYIVLLSRGGLSWHNVYLRTPLSIGLILLFSFYGFQDADSQNSRSLLRSLKKRLLYENKFLIYIGNISFELFLIHIQVKYVITYFFTKQRLEMLPLRLALIFLLSLVLAQLYASSEKAVSKFIHSRKK